MTPAANRVSSDPIADDQISTDWWSGVCQGPGLRIIGWLPATSDPRRVGAVVRRVEEAGYLAVDADADLPKAVRTQVCHRHVLLIQRGPLTGRGIRWLGDLAHASPRGHLVLAIGTDADAGAEHVAEGELEVHGGREADLVEAVEPVSRGTRWAEAATSYLQWMAEADLSTVSRASRAVKFGRRVLADVGDHPSGLVARSQVVAGMAEAWLTQAEWEWVVAGLARIEVECALAGVSIPIWIQARQVEVLCWLGRWDEARRLVSDASGAEAALLRPWSTVLALAQGDRAAAQRLWRARSDLSSLLPRRWRIALGLQAIRMVGRDGDAEAWTRKHSRSADARVRGPAEALLWQWVTSGSAGERALLSQEIRRTGADGIRRWGAGRGVVHMWNGVASLWQEVQEADDAVSAMRRGCRWVRQHTGVQAVAIAGGAPPTVLVCEPDSRHRDFAPATDRPTGAAIKYGGSTIGRVLLCGRVGDEGEATAVSAALASACAPAVRAFLDDQQMSVAGESVAGELLGISASMEAVRQQVARAARSSFPVLIEGESGTGKELVARAVHRISARRDRRWAAVNCAALTDELIESELFGHSRGAFTGAVGPRTGLMEDADGGTLFLDEVSELSVRAQAKLLRVLQEREIRRVGENQARRVDVRIVAACNRSLADAVEQGAFRQDLAFRLAVIRLSIPPLRARLEDLPLLAQAFWRQAAAQVQTRAVLAPDAILALSHHHWPGNVRELQNVIAALAVAGPTRGRVGARIVRQLLAGRSSNASCESGDTAADVAAQTLKEARRACDRRTIAAALARNAGRRSAAARDLGVSRQGLAKLMTRLEMCDHRIA